jgi:tape measure domain-containing protein
MANLSFAVAVNLLTEKFQSGKNKLLSSFNEIKMKGMEVASIFGVGLGFSALVEKMIEVTKESSAANQVLKNVSNTSAELVKNQRFLIEIADKYGLSVNDLTMKYARFAQAAKGSNMSMKDQQTVFSGFASQITKMGGSTEMLDATFEALTRMMTSGTISGRNFQRLISQIPGATDIFAKALGVTNSQFATMLKSGKAVASDVLVKVGKYLNEINKGVETNTLEGSINRLQNAFDELTKSSNFEEFYKSIIDGATNVVNFIKEHIKEVGNFIVSVIVGVIIGKGINRLRESYNSLLRLAKRNYKEQGEAATLSFNEQATAAEIATTKMKIAFIAVKNSIREMLLSFVPMLIISGIVEIIAHLIEWNNKQKEINNTFSDYLKEEKKVLNNTNSNSEILTLQAELSVMNDKKSTQEQQLAARQHILEMLGLEKNYEGDINKLVAERIKLLQAEANLDFYNSTVQQYSAKAEEQYQKLNINRNVANNLASDINNKVSADKWDNDIKKAYNVDDYYSVPEDQRNALKELAQDLKVWNDAQTKALNYLKIINNAGYNGTGKVKGTGDGDGDGDGEKPKSERQLLEEEYYKKIRELKNQLENKVITQQEFNKLSYELRDSTYKKGAAIESKEKLEHDSFLQGLKKSIDPEAHIKEIYTDEATKLKEQLDNGIIKQDEYNSSMKELTEETIKNLKSIGNVNLANDEFFKKLKEQSDNLDYTQHTDEFNKNINLLNKEFEHGIINQYELNDNTLSLIDSQIKYLLSLNKLTDAQKKELEGLEETRNNRLKNEYSISSIKETPIDHTFDYKKTNTEKIQDKIDNDKSVIDSASGKFKGVDIQEEIRKANENGTLDELKEKFHHQADALIDYLNEKMKEVDSLDKALKIEEVKQDIKDMQNQLNENLYEGIKNVAGGAKNLYDAFNNVKNAINDIHTTEFQKFLALWDAFTNTLDNIMSMVKMIKELTNVTNALTSAKKIEAAIDRESATEQLKNSAASAEASTLATVTNIANTKANVAANAVEAGSEQAKGTSTAVASAAKFPFPLNLILMASAAAAAMALFSKIPKFQDGGIVGGNQTSGDQLIARVNSGEMILNTNQQGTLFNMLNNNNKTINNKPEKIEFVIDGKYLKATLDNYNNIKSRAR